MDIVAYVCDSAAPAANVETVRARLEESGAEFELIDVAAANSRQEGRREAMLTIKNAVRIGSAPSELFDEDGTPDFSTGALITEESTGRRSLHVGREAVEILDSR